MHKPESIRIRFVSTEAIPGSHVTQCIKAAASLAMIECCEVRMEHNGKVYVASPQKIIDSVTEEPKA